MLIQEKILKLNSTIHLNLGVFKVLNSEHSIAVFEAKSEVHAENIRDFFKGGIETEIIPVSISSPELYETLNIINQEVLNRPFVIITNDCLEKDFAIPSGDIMVFMNAA
ncbi:MAG TPA: hypothetical protein VGE63_01990 [Candidatus Paceibacterota bacterium]